MDKMNIYLCGVGGQGIGLLSEVMIRSAMEAGYKVFGADTHGLAQRGGTVVSHLRIGDGVFTPIVPEGQADIVLALERIEGLRGLLKMLKPGGTVLYYDTAQQPIAVRTGVDAYPTGDDVQKAAEAIGTKAVPVRLEDLPDPRMQNVAVLGRFASLGLIEGMDSSIIEKVLQSVVPPKVVDANLKVFQAAYSSNDVAGKRL